MTPKLDGPRVPPARQGRPSSLVILLHGYGSNGDDLIALAPYWAGALPETQFVSPNAPEGIPGYPGGRQWFGLARMDAATLNAGAAKAAPALNAFIDSEMERYGVGPAQTALVGFSQGTMMALYTALRREKALAGVVGFSGALVSPEGLEAEMRAKPPILLAHGDRDDVVPVTALFEALNGLAKAGHGAELHLCAGLAHSIAPSGLERGGAFLKAAFAGRLR